MKALLLILACAGQAIAGGKETTPAPKVSVEIQAHREVKEVIDGKEKTVLAPVVRAREGEVIVYSVYYRNDGGAPAKKAVLTDPLPKGVICLPKSALSSDAVTEFSADGGATWGKLPLTRKEKNAEGKLEEKEVPDSAITHVRWTLKKDLAPGASGELRVQVKVK